MKQPFFSFIIPVYNAEKYISRCIDSLLDQDFTDVELIIINDGSTDESETIIKKYIDQHPEVIKYQYKNNEGIGPARNDGLSQATGQYVWFIDNDDCIKPNCLRVLYETLSVKTIDILDIGFCHEPYEENPLEKVKPAELIVQHITQKHAFIFCKDYPWSKIYKNKYLKEMQTTFPNVYGEDTATIYWLYANTNKILKTDTILYAWNNRDDSFSNKVLTEKHLNTFPRMIEILKNQSENAPWVKEEFNYIILKKARMIITHLENNKTTSNNLEILKENSISQVESIINTINGNIYIEINEYFNEHINAIHKHYEEIKFFKLYIFLRKLKNKILNMLRK